MWQCFLKSILQHMVDQTFWVNSSLIREKRMSGSLQSTCCKILTNLGDEFVGHMLVLDRPSQTISRIQFLDNRRELDEKCWDTHATMDVAVPTAELSKMKMARI